MVPDLIIICRYRYADPPSTAGPYWECVTQDKDNWLCLEAQRIAAMLPTTIAVCRWQWSLMLGVRTSKDHVIDPTCYQLDRTGSRPQGDKLKGLVMSYIFDHIFGTFKQELLEVIKEHSKEQPCPKTTKI